MVLFSVERYVDFRIGVTTCSPRTTSPSWNNYRVCHEHKGPFGEKMSANYNCRRSLGGRYVIFQLGIREYLNLCEFEVYGRRTHSVYTLKQFRFQHKNSGCKQILEYIEVSISYLEDNNSFYLN